MTKYLSYRFTDSPDFINTFDELPLWSAPFGLLLLDNIQFRAGITVIDIGSGAGFPLLEIASRLGDSCKCYGIDPWKNANARTKQKIEDYNLTNVQIIENSAENIPLDDGSVDLIVSNLGINNFENPSAIINECYRLLRPGGKIALTTNTNGHWQEFYNVFEHTLKQDNKTSCLSALSKHQEHRGSVSSISHLFTQSGFKITKTITETFKMNFLDGTAFLNHHFIKLGWLQSWIDIIHETDRENVFKALEENLNQLAANTGCLSLTVPIAFIEGSKE